MADLKADSIIVTQVTEETENNDNVKVKDMENDETSKITMTPEKADDVVDGEGYNQCTIEASVVTGFEECARGEAREKFGIDDVRAARGKITWTMDIDRVPEVLKMGSIDNARVVIYSLPNLEWTDQDSSLIRLQQLVPSLSWEKGLRVWSKLHSFPHSIAPHPAVPPSLEDLIDVCIVERKPSQSPAEGGGKKGRKGGRGKKKEKRKGGKEKGGGGGDGKKGDRVKDGAGDVPHSGRGAGDGDTVEGVSCEPGQTDHKDQTEACNTEQADKELSQPDSTNQCNGESATTTTQTTISSTDKSSNSSASAVQSAFHGLSPKRVFIKRADPNKTPPHIDIKVLIPAPSQDAFPVTASVGDARDLEPMDVDLNQSGITSLQASAGTPQSKVVPSQDAAGGLTKEKEELTNKAEQFASVVIEKLSTPPHSPYKASDAPCVTPPPTPDLSVTPTTAFSPLKDSSSVDGKDSLASLVLEKTGPGVSQAEDAVETSPTKKSCQVEQAAGDGAGKLEESNEFSVGESSVDPPELSLQQTPVLEDTLCTDLTEKATLHSDTTTDLGKDVATPITDLTESEGKTDSCCKNGEATAVTDLKESMNDATVAGATKLTNKKIPNSKRQKDLTMPTFRVTCNRAGDGHPFDSSSAAASFGSAIMTYQGWAVDLTKYNIEVILNIDNEAVSVALALTRSSLHNRNMVAFGPTTLRATICYNMLRLCRIRNGDFVCDPLCGTSALSVEGAFNWPNCFHFGGDFHHLAMGRSAKNTAALSRKMQEQGRGTAKVDTIQWNVEYFPLRDKTVDVFVSDLPFGHRIGSRSVNRTLYPCLLSQMARTGRPGSRACLLTEDKNSLIKAIQTLCKFWQRRLVLGINIGGLSGFVFLLTRTTAAWTPDAWVAPKPEPRKEKTEASKEKTEASKEKCEASKEKCEASKEKFEASKEKTEASTGEDGTTPVSGPAQELSQLYGTCISQRVVPKKGVNVHERKAKSAGGESTEVSGDQARKGVSENGECQSSSTLESEVCKSDDTPESEVCKVDSTPDSEVCHSKNKEENEDSQSNITPESEACQSNSTQENGVSQSNNSAPDSEACQSNSTQENGVSQSNSAPESEADDSNSTPESEACQSNNDTRRWSMSAE